MSRIPSPDNPLGDGHHGSVFELRIKRPPAGWRAVGRLARSGGLNVLRAVALGARLDLELDLLAAGEAVEVHGRGEAVAVEEVVLPVLGGNEGESAIGDELLDGSGGDG